MYFISNRQRYDSAVLLISSELEHITLRLHRKDSANSGNLSPTATDEEANHLVLEKQRSRSEQEKQQLKKQNNIGSPICLRREFSLTSLVVMYPSDEELVSQMSEELFLWHERRGKILYGLLSLDSDVLSSQLTTMSSRLVSPSMTTSSPKTKSLQLKTDQIKMERNSNIHKSKPSRNIWSFFSRRHPLKCTSFQSISTTNERQKVTSHEWQPKTLVKEDDDGFASQDFLLSNGCGLSASKNITSKSPSVLPNVPSQLTQTVSPAPTDPGKLHVFIVGNGPQPVIILHGMASSANFFLEGLLSRISASCRENVCTFYIPDMMGYGKSVRILANENYSAGEQASRVYCDVIRRFSLDTYHILGHSYGGMVAVALAAISPQHVRTLTLLSPAYFESVQIAKQVMKDSPFPSPYVARNPELGRRILQMMRKYLNPIVPTVASFIPSTTLTETALRELVTTEPEATLGTIETMKHDRIDGWLNVLRQHQLRILLLQADHDIIVPPRQGRKMALKFPNVIYRELHGTGHLFPQSHSALLASIFEHVRATLIGRSILPATLFLVFAGNFTMDFSTPKETRRLDYFIKEYQASSMCMVTAMCPATSIGYSNSINEGFFVDLVSTVDGLDKQKSAQNSYLLLLTTATRALREVATTIVSSSLINE